MQKKDTLNKLDSQADIVLTQGHKMMQELNAPSNRTHKWTLPAMLIVFGTAIIGVTTGGYVEKKLNIKMEKYGTLFDVTGAVLVLLGMILPVANRRALLESGNMTTDGILMNTNFAGLRAGYLSSTDVARAFGLISGYMTDAEHAQINAVLDEWNKTKIPFSLGKNDAMTRRYVSKITPVINAVLKRNPGLDRTLARVLRGKEISEFDFQWAVDQMNARLTQDKSR